MCLKQTAGEHGSLLHPLGTCRRGAWTLFSESSVFLPLEMFNGFPDTTALLICNQETDGYCLHASPDSEGKQHQEWFKQVESIPTFPFWDEQSACCTAHLAGTAPQESPLCAARETLLKLFKRIQFDGSRPRSNGHKVEKWAIAQCAGLMGKSMFHSLAKRKKNYYQRAHLMGIVAYR